MPVANNLILEEWTILSLLSTPLTGMTTPADIAFTLHRQSGSTFIAAAEVITFAEIGATGHYYMAFTPASTGLYVLQLTESNVLTLQRTARFSYEVLSAGAVFTPTFSNAYCAETDVERYAGLAFTASSTVTSTQAAAFAEERATILTSLLAGWGVTISPSSVVAGSRLEDMLRAANAIGAAVDALIAWFGMTEPGKLEKAATLEALWTRYIGGMVDGKKLEGYLENEAKSTVSLALDHVTSGDTTARASENAPQDIGLQIRMSDTY
jgi:hypothetical protein